jgi:hypothetical protein
VFDFVIFSIGIREFADEMSFISAFTPGLGNIGAC